MKTAKLILVSCVVVCCFGMLCFGEPPRYHCPCYKNNTILENQHFDKYQVWFFYADETLYNDVQYRRIYFDWCKIHYEVWHYWGTSLAYRFGHFEWPGGCWCPCSGEAQMAPGAQWFRPAQFKDSNGTNSLVVSVDDINCIRIIDFNNKSVVYDYNFFVPAGQVVTIPTGGLESGNKYIMVGYGSEGNMKTFLPFTKLEDWVQELPHSDWTGMGKDGIERGCDTYLDNNNVKILVQSPNKSWAVIDSNSPVPVKPCVLLPPNNAAWWTLDESEGSIAHDIVNHNDGNLMGSPVAVAGKVDGGLQLDGVDDYVQAPNDVTLNFGTGDFSIDAWVKPSNAGPSERAILDKRSGTEPNQRGYELRLFLGKLSLQLGDGNSFRNYNSTLPSVADGNWHHVAATVNRDDPNGLKLYVDGVSQTFDPTDRQGSLDNDANLLIGASCLTTSSRFNGDIDEVDLFKRALDPYEIQSIFRAGSYGKCKQKPDSQCKKADLNNDDIVNFQDLAILANCWLVNCQQ